MKETLGFMMVYVPVEVWMFHDLEVTAGVDYDVYYVAPNSRALFKRGADDQSEYLGVLTTDVATLSALRNGSMTRHCKTEFEDQVRGYASEDLAGVTTFQDLEAAVAGRPDDAGSPLVRLYRSVMRSARFAQEAQDLGNPPSVRYRNESGVEIGLPGTFAGAEVRPRVQGLRVPDSYHRAVGSGLTAGR